MRQMEVVLGASPLPFGFLGLETSLVQRGLSLSLFLAQLADMPRLIERKVHQTRYHSQDGSGRQAADSGQSWLPPAPTPDALRVADGPGMDRSAGEESFQV